MQVLVLDPRWPSMVPLDAIAQITGPVHFTDDVPAEVRALFPQNTTGNPWLITTVDPGGDALRVPSLADPTYRATQVMHAARTRGEWERSMTHHSLLTYLREEAAEFAEAVEQGASEQELKQELADVFLQVLFHSELAHERGAFTFQDVAQAFVEKMESRAPYLFDGSTGIVDIATQDKLWAEGKTREKARSSQEHREPH